jgi:hypothetical protein
MSMILIRTLHADDPAADHYLEGRRGDIRISESTRSGVCASQH